MKGWCFLHFLLGKRHDAQAAAIAEDLGAAKQRNREAGEELLKVSNVVVDETMAKMARDMGAA